MRIKTKKQRLDLQDYLFNQLIEKGYKREDYNGLIIFNMTDDKSTWLKIFRGTSTKEILFQRYRTKEQAEQQITRSKANADRVRKYKEDLKANPTKSSSANCAIAIREELKKHFPKIKFSVTSSNFSGGDSVRVKWTDGPTEKQVREFTSKYQYGRFNGMEDIYEYTNSRQDIPQSKYVQEERQISDGIKEIVFNALKPLFKEEDEHELKVMSNRIIYNTNIPSNAIVTGLKRTGINCGSVQDFYTLDFETTKNEEEPEKTNFEAVEVPAGEIQIVDYSEKSFAVIGETKPIKDHLKELGGKFNFRLSCGAGWIFPKTKLQEVTIFLTQKAK